MRKFTFVSICIMFVSMYAVKAQQINNADFESWDNIGAATEEPTEWNSFKTASGLMAAWVSKQLSYSLVTRPGSPGDSSCVLWSKAITIGPTTVVANGIVTTGRINAGSAIAADTSNYNATRTAQPLFSEALGARPDSLVVWVRFKPANISGTDSARIRATIHDTYDLRDPLNAASIPHLVGDATKNFPTTNNLWTRLSIPFQYTGSATSPNFILISLTTNKTPGAGSGGDSLYVDDLSLIYNPGNSVEDINYSKNFNVYANDNDIFINLGFDKTTTSDIAIYNLTGQLVFKKQITSSFAHEKVNISAFVKGIYLVSIITETGQRFSQKIAVK
jgi:hypothetical protein